MKSGRESGNMHPYSQTGAFKPLLKVPPAGNCEAGATHWALHAVSTSPAGNVKIGQRQAAGEEGAAGGRKRTVHCSPPLFHARPLTSGVGQKHCPQPPTRRHTSFTPFRHERGPSQGTSSRTPKVVEFYMGSQPRTLFSRRCSVTNKQGALDTLPSQPLDRNT